MFIREELHMIERSRIRETGYLPEWIRAEHMERFVPLKELWRFSKPTGRGKRTKI